jgi:hypothetical protein
MRMVENNVAVHLSIENIEKKAGKPALLPLHCAAAATAALHQILSPAAATPKQKNVHNKTSSAISQCLVIIPARGNQACVHSQLLCLTGCCCSQCCHISKQPRGSCKQQQGASHSHPQLPHHLQHKQAQGQHTQCVGICSAAYGQCDQGAKAVQHSNKKHSKPLSHVPAAAAALNQQAQLAAPELLDRDPLTLLSCSTRQ